jgi:regulator of replication initiation timing
MSKSDEYQKELDKLTEIFADVEDSKRKLVEGLLEDAAFLKSENYELKQFLKETGMVNIHPQHKQLQKPIEAARQYLKNVNSYAVIIKTLNGVLNKNILEDDDELSDFE